MTTSPFTINLTDAPSHKIHALARATRSAFAPTNHTARQRHAGPRTQTAASHTARLAETHLAGAGRQPRPGRRTKPIEAIELGDMVWAWDEVAGALVRRPVVRLFRHQGKPIIAVTVFGGDGAVQRIECTTEHPFWVEGKGWVAACALQTGDLLKRIGTDDCLRVAFARPTGTNADVFNFEVADVHNYFVGAAGVLVHNDSGERFGIEFEKRPGMLGHLLDQLDLADYERRTGIRLSKLVDEQPIELRTGSQNERTARALIRSHEEYSYSMATNSAGEVDVVPTKNIIPLHPNIRASERFVRTWNEYDHFRDGGTLEMATAARRPRYGFDGIAPAVNELEAMFQQDSGVTTREVARAIHIHTSTPYPLWPVGHATNSYLALEALSNGGLGVLQPKKYSYQPVTGKGFVRVIDPFRIETRHMNRPGGLYSAIDQTVAHMRSPKLAYADLAATLGHAKMPESNILAVEVAFASVKRPVLVSDIHALLPVPEAAKILVPAIRDLAGVDAAMSRALLGEAGVTYSF